MRDKLPKRIQFLSVLYGTLDLLLHQIRNIVGIDVRFQNLFLYQGLYICSQPIIKGDGIVPLTKMEKEINIIETNSDGPVFMHIIKGQSYLVYS